MLEVGDNSFLYYAVMTLIIGVPIVIAITFHEAAHGYVALKLGDTTAYVLGRVTFNPLKHIDPIGTILIPGALILMGAPFIFGYAKPVPVDFSRLRNPKRDMIWVAAAGPGTNLVLAYISAVLIKLFTIVEPTEVNILSLAVAQSLQFSILINVVLAVFNMLPLPPLDGGRVAVGLLPPALGRRLASLERYGFLILIALIFLVPILARQMGFDFNPFREIILPPVKAIISFFYDLVGLS